MLLLVGIRTSFGKRKISLVGKLTMNLSSRRVVQGVGSGPVTSDNICDLVGEFNFPLVG